MRDSGNSGNERGNMERLGESAGAMAGRAADFGMEVSGALFRSAAEMLGGWWSSDAPQQAAGSWTDRAEGTCRSHYTAAAGGSVGGANAGGTRDASNVAPKSSHGAMQTAGQMTTATDGSGAFETTGAAQIGDTRVEGSMSLDSASDGFERARPGYQLGYVARQNPAYRGRNFTDIEPELRKVWESRAQTQGSGSASSSTWPEVRGFVDFAYQQGGETDR